MEEILFVLRILTTALPHRSGGDAIRHNERNSAVDEGVVAGVVVSLTEFQFASGACSGFRYSRIMLVVRGLSGPIERL